MNTKKPEHAEELADIINRANLDIRMVRAIAGDRTLNAREQNVLDRLMEERGEGIYSDMLYTITHRAFPARQAKHLWDEISKHREQLKLQVGRDMGVALAAHDYLANVAGLMKGVSIIEETKMASLTSVATSDGLTGLYDQSTFKHKLKEELERQVRYGGSLSLVMFDIDHFKNINDTYGHAEGDVALKQIADIVRAEVRLTDTAARYGGEEFTVILSEVDVKSAFIFAERLRQNVERTFAEGSFPLTISVGVAASVDGIDETPENLIKKADFQLYEAKNSGRNRVCTVEL